MKKLISLFTAFCMFLILSLSAFAVESDYLIDNADLLTEDEEVLLLTQIEEVINNNGIDIIIHTTPDTDGKEVYEYADDFYDNGGYSSDGLIFVISMAERDYYTSTCGSLVDSLPDYAIDSLCKPVVPYLSDGEYYEAFSLYLKQIDNYLNGDWYISGGSYDDSFDDYYNDNYYYEDEYHYSSGSSVGSNVFVREIILIVIAVIIAVIITSILKSKMNTAVKKHDADDYVVSGSFRLDLKRDLFVGSTVTKRPLPKNNNNGSRPGGGGGGVRMSSGGVRHGGSGGKF